MGRVAPFGSVDLFGGGAYSLTFLLCHRAHARQGQRPPKAVSEEGGRAAGLESQGGRAGRKVLGGDSQLIDSRRAGVGVGGTPCPCSRFRYGLREREKAVSEETVSGRRFAPEI